ncbi:hypothetical protein FQR65_LT02175 [Abscondita terminalis]|nr:hypothetical protein FQR65_LT02175 [Abscondita terminalis]
MEKFEEGRVSENEDDPDVYESSGDEWNEEVEEKKGGNRRSSQRLSKKPRVSHTEVSSDSDAAGDGKKKASKNGIKRQKLDPEAEEDAEEEEDIEEEEEEDEEEEEGSVESSTNNKTTPKKSSSKNSDFVNGGFLILKKDADSGNKNLCLWRIDGKALLQKYEPFEEEGQTKHRNTSIYTGWSSMDKDLYYPVVVKVLRHHGQNMTVEMNWEKLKELTNESE